MHQITTNNQAAVEWSRLREWAEKNGMLGGELPREDSRGGEHIVELDWTRGLATKATIPRATKLTPSQYLNRIAAHNRFFNDAIKLEQIVPMPDGMLSIVTSQPLITGRNATMAEINAMMEEKGFEKIANGLYYHASEAALVYDLFPANVKVDDASGTLRPIDTVILSATPVFAEFLKANVGRVDRNASGQPDMTMLLQQAKAA